MTKRVPDGERIREERSRFKAPTPEEAAGAFDPDDDWAPDTEEVRERLRHAMGYLKQSKPGKRMPSLLAVWRASTGMESLTDYRVAEAVRTYRCLRSTTRAHVRSALIACGRLEPRRAEQTDFFGTVDRLADLEERIKIPPRRPSRMGRPPKLVVVR